MQLVCCINVLNIHSQLDICAPVARHNPEHATIQIRNLLIQRSFGFDILYARSMHFVGSE